MLLRIGGVGATLAGQVASSTASFGVTMQDFFMLLFSLLLTVLWIYIAYRKIERISGNTLDGPLHLLGVASFFEFF